MDPKVITVPTNFPMVALVGPNDSYLRIIEKQFPQLSITLRGNEIYVKGDAEKVTLFSTLKNMLMQLIQTQLLLELVQLVPEKHI